MPIWLTSSLGAHAICAPPSPSFCRRCTRFSVRLAIPRLSRRKLQIKSVTELSVKATLSVSAPLYSHLPTCACVCEGPRPMSAALHETKQPFPTTLWGWAELVLSLSSMRVLALHKWGRHGGAHPQSSLCENTGGVRIQGHPCPHSKFKASLEHMGLCFKPNDHVTD